jgi:F5/8 type C domain
LLDGKDWQKDRWALPLKEVGSHWIQFNWDENEPVLITRVIVDWETAFASDYELQIAISDHEWETVATSPDPNITIKRWVLHHLHEIDIPVVKPTNALRLFVHKPATESGLSVWQVRVYGYKSTDPARPIALGTPMVLTAQPDSVLVTASDPGYRDLGVEKVLQGGTEWKKDCWGVSCDNICGSLWVRIDFPQQPVLITQVILDWETAYATDYKLQIGTTDNWRTIRKSPDPNNITVETLGRRPTDVGDNSKHVVPLHYVHNIKVPVSHQPTRSLRLFIRKPATEWGVSLWQIKVYGYKL